MQHWARILLGSSTPRASDKTKAELHCQSLSAKQTVDKPLLRYTGHMLWEILDCVLDCILVITEKVVTLSTDHLSGAQL